MHSAFLAASLWRLALPPVGWDVCVALGSIVALYECAADDADGSLLVFCFGGFWRGALGSSGMSHRCEHEVDSGDGLPQCTWVPTPLVRKMSKCVEYVLATNDGFPLCNGHGPALANV
eukprot:scaffold16119_cov18-Tisochrysis_lutea.AAC.4